MSFVTEIEKSNSKVYPRKYTNLLIEAGLIGHGIKEINAYYSEERSMTLDETSQTWERTHRPKVDYRDVPLHICPIIGKNNRVLGSWTAGLDQKTVDIIHKECGIPIYDGSELLRFMHGDVLDLSNPFDMAKFRIMLHCREVAFSKGEMPTGVHYYFSSKEDAIKEVKGKIMMRKTAQELNEKLNVNIKRDILMFMSHEYDLLMNAYTMPNADVHDIFEGYVYGDEIMLNRLGMRKSCFAAVVDAHKRPDKTYRNMANLAVNLAVVRIEGKAGKVSRHDGTPIAMDFETFAQLLIEDDVIYQDIGRKVEEAQRGVSSVNKRELSPESKKTINVGLVKTFDTHINNVADITHWGLGACVQYVKEKGIEHELTELSSVDEWQVLVKNIHQKTHVNQPPPEINQYPLVPPQGLEMEFDPANQENNDLDG